MYLIKEPVDTIIVSMEYDAVFEVVVSKLRELGFEIEKQDKNKREIVIRCLVVLFDVVLYKWWADRLLIKFDKINETKTLMDIFGIPIWFRLRVGKDEKVHNLKDITRQIKEIFVEAGDYKRDYYSQREKGNANLF